ncbi:MAG: carboxypeptidase-like regulatory domain-containing protein, partial [Saprospiraceae bacterium]|nr:carboxypeptidase-like regulatory domain-containing protein [Saprospiraceae bacterium]
MQLIIRLFLGFFLVFLNGAVFSQYKTIVSGRVTDIESNQGIEFANIRVDGTTKGVESDVDGKYEIVLNTNEKVKLIFSRVGYKPIEHTIPSFSQGQLRLNLSMVPNDSKLEFIITEEKIISGGMVKQNVEELKLLPSASGN